MFAFAAALSACAPTTTQLPPRGYHLPAQPVQPPLYGYGAAGDTEFFPNPVCMNDEGVIESATTPGCMNEPTSPKQPIRPTSFIMPAGGTLMGAVRYFGVTLDALLRANPEITDPNRVLAGTTLRLPPR